MDLKWQIGGANPDSAVLVHKEKHLVVNFNMTRVIVSRESDEMIPTPDAEKLSLELAKESELAYELLTDLFSVPNTTRVGARFTFAAKMGSLEDAQRLTARAVAGGLSEKIESLIASNLFEGRVNLRFDDADSGIRRSVSIGTMIVKEPAIPFTGLRNDSADAAVIFDVDAFTRPEVGNFNSVRPFVANAYTKSHSLALELFNWLNRAKKEKA